MVSNWSLTQNAWGVSWPERISRHDLFYESPPDDPLDGFPIGNGRLGAMVWTAGSRLILALNHTDTWDAPERRSHFEGWAPEGEESYPVLRHLGRIEIDLGLPVWDVSYLARFDGILSLADATVSLKAETPFGRAEIELLASEPDQVLAARVTYSFAEAISPRVSLERWGGRSFGHWFHQIKRQPELGLDGTSLTIEHDRIALTQQMSKAAFAVQLAAEADASGSVSARPQHRRRGAIDLPKSDCNGFTLLLAAATTSETDQPKALARERVDIAKRKGYATVRGAHSDSWRETWLRSYLNLSDSYLASIWHVTIYLAASSCRGHYPPHFAIGLWRHQRDFCPWYFYFHWNTQWQYWQLHPAGLGGLTKPLFNYRFSQLSKAKSYARETHQADGAFFADVADCEGYQDLDTQKNHTPGPQIALLFWRHFRFTNDHEFLRERAFPLMSQVAKWYLDTLEHHEDGAVHPPAGTTYESDRCLTDPVTDIAMMRALFSAVIEASSLVEEPDIDLPLIRDSLLRLVPAKTEVLTDSEMTETDNGPELGSGSGAAAIPESKEIIAAGFDPEQGRWLRKRTLSGGLEGDYYGTTDPELSLVFPAGVVGLDHRGSSLFRAMINQAKLHPAAPNDESLASDDPDYGCMGWCPYPIVCARLGLGDAAAKAIRDSIRLWQHYPQGLGHYGDIRSSLADLRRRDKVHRVHDADDFETVFPVPARRFRHSSNEAMPIASTAINEMLIQSHESVIRVGPAVPSDWDAQFTLLAEGGFRVSSEIKGGRPSWIVIESCVGGNAAVEIPWPGPAHVWVKISPNISYEPLTAYEINNCILRIACEPGEFFLIADSADHVERWQTQSQNATANRSPRCLGPAILGKLRDF